MKSSIMKKICYSVIFCISTLFLSCVEDLDFDQAEDFSAEPVIVSSLAFFDEPAQTFIIDPGDSNVISDTLSVDIFSDSFVVDNLIRAEFFLETTNSINRAFLAQVDFFNDDFELLDSFAVDVLRSPSNANVITEFTQVFIDEDLNAFKETTEIVFTLTLVEDESLPPVDGNTLGRIRFNSMGTFFFSIGSSE